MSEYRGERRHAPSEPQFMIARYPDGASSGLVEVLGYAYRQADAERIARALALLDAQERESDRTSRAERLQSESRRRLERMLASEPPR